MTVLTVNVIQKVLVYRAGDAFFSGAGADPVWSEPGSAPGPLTSGVGARAAEKSGGSATLAITEPVRRHFNTGCNLLEGVFGICIIT